MNIIHTTTALAPEYGGPVRSVPALCKGLADLGNDVTLVYLDFGQRFTDPVMESHPGLRYVRVEVLLKWGMRPILQPGYQAVLDNLAGGKQDLIFHDHGIWLPYSGRVLSAAKKHSAKLVCTPRGMLEPWSMEFRRFRKMAAWHLYQKSRLEACDLVHATAEGEGVNLRKLGVTPPIAVIPNGTDLPVLSDRPPDRSQGMRRMLFLSRIHQKKGLPNLIAAVDKVRPVGWKILIAGYDEQGYQASVERMVRESGLEEYFDFIGPVADQDKWDLYRSAEVFILPSYSENFGLVVAEALASGIPAITTTGTPWKDLVDYNCGWWVEPTAEGVAEALSAAVSLPDQQLRVMGRNGRQLIERKYSWQAVAAAMNEVYQWLLSGDRQELDLIRLARE